MAAPIWPGTVPFESEAEGAGATPTYAPPQSSETEGGTAITRPRPGPRVTETSWRSVPLDGAEWTAFEQFARLDLRDGSLDFDMPVYRPGAGYVTRRCRLKGGIYATDPSQVPWTRVSFTLIIFNW